MTMTRATLLRTTGAVLTIASLALAATATTLYKGQWKKVYAETSGSWKIVGSEYGTTERTLKLSDDFKTDKADGLKIYLATKPLAELNDDNATDGAKLIGELKMDKGAQTYDIPVGTMLSEYKSIIIDNTASTKLWAGSDLGSPMEGSSH